MPLHEGRHNDTLELEFQDSVTNWQFSITRDLSATVGSKIDQETLKPKTPYVKPKFVPLNLDGPIISPLRPPTWTENKWVVRLPEYKAPANLIKAAYGRKGRKVVTQEFMPAVLNNGSHGKYYQTLLWIEEEQRRCVSNDF